MQTGFVKALVPAAALVACGAVLAGGRNVDATSTASAPLAQNTPDTALWTSGTLLFQTGFGGSTRLEPLANGNHHPTGRDDALTSSDWKTDIARFGNPSRTNIEYTGGNVRQRLASIAADPTNAGNAVLRFVLREAWPASENETKARVQLDLYGLHPGFREFHQSVRVRLSPDFRNLESYPARIGWLTLAEYWNNEWWNRDSLFGFRITVGIGKPDAGAHALNLFVEAEDKGRVHVWRVDDPTAKIPVGQWFTLDTYYREGNRGSGRFMLAVTPEDGARRVVYDVQNFTHNTGDPAPDGVTGYNPVKFYTSQAVVDHVRKSGGALQIDWDDLKIWRIR